MSRLENSLIARGYSRDYAESVAADARDRAHENERDRQAEDAARLRDAAPDLLAALVALVNEADSHGGSTRTVTRYSVDHARAAIAKATR